MPQSVSFTVGSVEDVSHVLPTLKFSNGTHDLIKSCLILADATSGNITFNLPTCDSLNGRMFIVKKIDSSVNTVTLNPDGSDTIDGAASLVISSQWDAETIVCESTDDEWNRMAQYP